MDKRFPMVSCLGVLVLLVAGLACGSVASTYSSTARYSLGKTVLFGVEEEKLFCLSCCWGSCCQPTPCEIEVLGWHIMNACGESVYSVVHDVAVPASTWEGSWVQVDAFGTQVAAGYYKLCVDTSAGTISRCFEIYDPCPCWLCSCCEPKPRFCWSFCSCRETPSAKLCCRRATLEFVEEKRSSCFSLCCP